VWAARSAGSKLRDGTILVLLAAAAFLVHGYHPYVEDAAFYIPAVEKALNPGLFPYGAEFFESHGALTLFPQLVAASVRLTHLPLETVLLLWQLLCVFLFLLGCWRVSRACFEEPEARWGGVGAVAALLTLPAGATTLLLLDQYLNPRSISSCATMFAVALALEERYLAGVLVLAAASLVHPMMPVYAGFFLLLLWWNQRRAGAVALAALAPFGISLDAPTPAYHQAAMLHRWHYIQFWTIPEWLGLLAPVALFFWFARLARTHRMRNVELLSRSLLLLLLFSLAGALVLDIPPRFEALARLQPMRSMHLAYILMFLLLGGILGRFVLRRKMWRWLLVFIPLSAGAASVQLSMYRASAHLEWPGVPSRNAWVQAFVWIREHTPENAYFALDPEYLNLPGEDGHPFRPIAERSMLADIVKDGGAVSMFPSLAEKWWEQVEAQRGWFSEARGALRGELGSAAATGSAWSQLPVPKSKRGSLPVAMKRGVLLLRTLGAGWGRSPRVRKFPSELAWV
jgi:hypothetical protein